VLIRGKVFLVAILLVMLLMLVPYLPWFKPATSKQAEIANSPPDELREEIDSDGDLLVDNDEVYITDTNPDLPDSDDDGMIDGEEYKYWTDRYKSSLDENVPDWLKEKYPYLTEKERKGQYLSTGDLDGDGRPNIKDKDSDNDGLPDGFEVYYELDPADPKSNFTDLPDNIQRYIIVNTNPDSNIMDFETELDMNDFYSDSYDANDFDDVLFRVTPAAYPRYWRTAVYDYYYSGIWDVRNTGAYFAYEEQELELENKNITAKHDITYTITFNGMARGSLPTALHTTRVFSIKPESYIKYSKTRTFESYQYIKSYSFNATILEYDMNELLNSDAPMSMENHFLTDTNSIHSYISTLALDITSDADGSSDFEKASLIAKYLRTNYIYDLNSYEYNLAYPSNDYKLKYISNYDKVIINMLLQTYRGRCLDFATAFVLMCRANDIPAQLVVGYAPGDIDDPSQNSRVVRVGHKHAWAEVLLDVGWVPFEVTPSRAIHGNTTGVSVSGIDENVVSYPADVNDTGDEFDGGSGGGTTTPEYVDILELINSSKLDSDNDGIKNHLDTDDDNDGLSDLEEIELGTNPFSKDTDRDGLTDSDEVNNHGTSPLNTDSDSDGLTDSYELLVSDTNPLEYDTDSGGAYDGLEVQMKGNPNNPNDDKNFIDSDKDGLSDAEEEKLGTDPNLYDTDGGGASDKLEQLAGLDPINDPEDDLKALDSDNDGLMDSKELEIGTNRFIYDTDSGGVGDGREYLNKYNPLNSTDDFKLMDSDNDGLINADEEKWGTNIHLSDSDHGGVSDGVEVKYGYHPLDAEDDSEIDIDDDGLSNIDEQRLGTDPFKVDTDNDKLPDGWVDYNKNGVKDLGEFEDRNLDGYREYEPWNNGSGPGETSPLYADTDQDGLNDGLEISIGTDPLDYDSDDDGLSDGDEIRLLTNPNNEDTDSDGLTDGAEVGIHKSNPTLLDSDGDGLDDWLEIEFGTDPFSVDTDHDGVMDLDEIDLSSLATDYPDIDFNSHTGPGPNDIIRPNPPEVRPDPGDTGYQPEIPDTIDSPNPSTGSTPDFGGGGAGGHLANVWPIIIGMILMVIIGLYYVNWRSQHIEEIAEVAERAEEQLSKIKDEREFDSIQLAIFEAYKSMLKIMQRYDFVRNPATTPSEFKNIIAKALPISDKNIITLTSIFEEARYSDHKLDANIRDKAIASFRELKNELRGVSRLSIEAAKAKTEVES
jgi:transglutaminase-like putative cysteine protease